MDFNPPFNTEIKAGDTLVILGSGQELKNLEAVTGNP